MFEPDEDYTAKTEFRHTEHVSSPRIAVRSNAARLLLRRYFAVYLPWERAAAPFP
jgi:hypothetical protein